MEWARGGRPLAGAEAGVAGQRLAVFAAWRARAVPLAAVLLNVVGWVVFTLFSRDAWLPSIGTGLAAIGLAWCGVIVLKMRDEVWQRIWRQAMEALPTGSTRLHG